MGVPVHRSFGLLVDVPHSPGCLVLSWLGHHLLVVIRIGMAGSFLVLPFSLPLDLAPQHPPPIFSPSSSTFPLQGLQEKLIVGWQHCDHLPRLVMSALSGAQREKKDEGG